MIPSPANYTRVTGVSTEVLITPRRCALIAVIPDTAASGTITLRESTVANGTGGMISTLAAGAITDGLSLGSYGVQLKGLTAQNSMDTAAFTVVWAPLP